MLTIPRDTRFYSVIMLVPTNASEGEVSVPELVWAGLLLSDAEKHAQSASIEHPTCSFVVMQVESAFRAAPAVSQRFYLDFPDVAGPALEAPPPSEQVSA